jgi:general stress protein 26
VSVDVNDRAEVEADLWEQIGDARQGMLGIIEGSPLHFQPMTPNREKDEGRIWFFIRTSAELHQALDQPREAMFIIQRKDYQACIGGRLSRRLDRDKVDEYWNPVIAAWFEGGKEDPELGLICFDCRDAEIWLNEAKPVRFAWEIARANMTGRDPDVGDRASLSFN